VPELVQAKTVAVVALGAANVAAIAILAGPARLTSMHLSNPA
jgi:hypothetical protein